MKSSREWRDPHIGLLESRLQSAQDRRCVGVVTVNAERLGGNVQLRAVVGGDGLSLDQHDRALDGALHVVDNGSFLVAWNQGAVGPVRTVNEGLAGERNPARSAAPAISLPAIRAASTMLRLANSRHNGCGRFAIAGRAVVKRAMRLHIRQFRALRAAYISKRPKLVGHMD